MSYTVPHFIDGECFSDLSSDLHPITNPALGETIGQVGFASSTTCNKAISSSKLSFLSWSQTSAVKRAQILYKFRELLDKHRQELAEIVCREHGKTLADADGSIARGIELVEHHCGLITQLQGSQSINVTNHVDCATLRQPLGVCVGVSPFNFPVMVPLWMIIPAIACGNTFILKPSEQDPSAPVRLLELLSEAGLPPGVVNCVQGDKDIVEQLITHQDIVAVTAVASTPVAEYIYKTAINHGKRSATFGGAKNHCVVMPDADLEQAAKAIVGAAYGSAGERCMAISVVVACGDETADALLAELKPQIESIVIDKGDAVGCEMGPLISSAHRKRVLAAIDQGISEGAKLLIDGRQFKHKQHSQGYFLGPSLFDQVTQDMSVYQNEIFGPVLVVVRAPDFEAAIEFVNENQYGNGTAIFTRDGFSAREYALRVQVGMVGVNIPIPVPIASHPFGGWKHSSFGDTNMHGMESIHFYTKLKTVTTKWFATDLQDSKFSMPTHL